MTNKGVSTLAAFQMPHLRKKANGGDAKLILPKIKLITVKGHAVASVERLSNSNIEHAVLLMGVNR